MKYFLAIAVAMISLSMNGCGSGYNNRNSQVSAFDSITDAPPAYHVGAGDDLSVIFPYLPELNYEGPVGPDSRFTMPVAGTIVTLGKTVPEVEAAISSALEARHIAAGAAVSVSIRRYAQVIYVGGEVRTPGAIPLQSRMDPLQAITMAGGLLDTARSSEVVIIRRGADGQPELRVVDINAYIKSGASAEAPPLRAQDTIFVPKSSIAEVDLWIDQYINKTLPFNRGLSYTFNSNLGNTTTGATTATPTQ